MSFLITSYTTNFTIVISHSEDNKHLQI